jgi:hypothetical protein
MECRASAYCLLLSVFLICLLYLRERKKQLQEANERSGNIYENKGPSWKKWQRSGNIYENKGSYEFKAGMYLKTRELMWCRCVSSGSKTKSRLGGQANP